MTNENILKTIKGDWFVKITDDYELANFINLCIDAEITWRSSEIKSDLPNDITRYPVFIGLYQENLYYSHYKYEDCQDITDLIFTDAKHDHFHEILDAWLKGQKIEFKSKTANEWTTISGDIVFNLSYEYRIKPKMTPLNIPEELLKFLNKSFKWFAMDEDGEVYAFSHKPIINKEDEIWEGGPWDDSGDFQIGKISNILDIDTKGVDWRLSLTKRYDN